MNATQVMNIELAHKGVYCPNPRIFVKNGQVIEFWQNAKNSLTTDFDIDHGSLEEFLQREEYTIVSIT